MKPKSEIEEALRFDGISEAERIVGQSYKENEDVVWLGMRLQQQQAEKTNALLFLNHDTNSNKQSISEFLSVLIDMGFEEVLKLAIENTEDHFYIFWKPGLLIRLDTYMNRSVNSGSCYFNFKGPWESLSGCSYGGHGAGEVVSGDRDIRQGLRDFLDRPGEFVSPWEHEPFLWLLHYMDTKVDGYDYKQINEDRIALLPDHVRKNLFPTKS